MLIVDLSGEPDLFRLRHASLSGDSSMIDHLNKAGMQEIVTTPDNLSELENLIDQNGSAIVSMIDSQIGGHVIVVDSVDPQGVKPRDPYHG